MKDSMEEPWHPTNRVEHRSRWGTARELFLIYLGLVLMLAAAVLVWFAVIGIESWIR